jgi:N-methylhydantoinase A
MKFRLQIHRVEVPVPEGELSAQDTEQLMTTFTEKYESLYGRGSAFTGAGMEIGVLRLIAVGSITKPSLSRPEHKTSDALAGYREVYWRERRRFERTPIYQGAKLANGSTFEAPAIIEMPETTIVLRPGSKGRLDDYGNFVITLA